MRDADTRKGVGLKLKVDGKTGVVEVVSRPPPLLPPLLLLHVGYVAGVSWQRRVHAVVRQEQRRQPAERHAGA